MKKVVARHTAITAILTGVVLIFYWYWMMKRELPSQARVIPKDAIAVLTFNLRELAIDLKSDEHLFPEMADQSIVGKELEPFTRAVTANDGETGVAETSDVLLFVYNTGEEGYFGITIALEDSAAFGELMRNHVSKEYNITPLSMGGIPLMQFDTTAAVFGWTNDVALLLYPLGNHSIPLITAQCTKLLNQTEENSLLVNENFQDMEMESFAVGLWVQTKPMLAFTDGGSLMEDIAHDVETYSYFANFEAGEILIRAEWQLPDDAKRAMIKEFEFPCDTSLITSFMRGRFDTKSTSFGEYTDANRLLENLPIAEEDYPELFSSMSGDYISIGHSNMDTLRGFETQCFFLSDPLKAKTFITARMERDSIPLTSSGWKYAANDIHTWRMIIDNNLLTITNHPQVDGRSHGITPELAGYMAWFNFRKIFSDVTDGNSPFLEQINRAAPLLSKHLTTCSSTLPVQFGNVRHSEIVFRFRNTEVNALVQTEELVRKIYLGK